MRTWVRLGLAGEVFGGRRPGGLINVREAALADLLRAVRDSKKSAQGEMLPGSRGGRKGGQRDEKE